MIFEQLQEFRQGVYEQLGKARDAVFELMDAVLVSPSIPSFVSLSLSPVFRRGWPSVYAALQDSRISPNRVMKQVTALVATQEQPLLVGDRSGWRRPEAETLRERTYDHESGDRISVGHSYSTLAWIPEATGSWALPLRHERITSYETPVSKAAFQLKQVTRELEVRPLALYDRGYGNANFVNQTASIEADLLLRLSRNRCVYGVPPAYGGRGRPPKHGDKFKFSDPSHWPEEDESRLMEDPTYGRVRLTRWWGYHFCNSSQRPMDIIFVEVIEPVGSKAKFQGLWLAYLGSARPALETLGLIYLRRFAIEHWYRLSKQRLHWTRPQLHSTPATERWSFLMILMSWQLWLARNDCTDAPLPWQPPQDKMAPGRVAQAFASILLAVGTPAKPPKPRGKSPGRAFGEQPQPPTHYPTVKKRPSKSKKSPKLRKLPLFSTA